MPSRRSSSVGSGMFKWRSAAEVPLPAWPSSGVLPGDWFSEHHKAAQRWPSLLASKGQDHYFSCHCGFHPGPLHQGSQTTAPGPQSIHPLSAFINRVSLDTAVLLHLLLSKAASVLAWQSWGVATEATEPQIFHIWTFTEQVWNPALDVGLSQRCNTQHGQTGRLGPAQLTCGAQCKMKTQGPALIRKNHYEFQDGNSRAVNQACIKPVATGWDGGIILVTGDKLQGQLETIPPRSRSKNSSNFQL